MNKLTSLRRLLPAAALVLLLALLAPMLLLGRYAVPGADDYTYGAAAYHALRAGAPAWRAIPAAAGVARDAWFDWQGTFSAIFLMALQPAVFADGLYALTPCIMLFFLLLGIFSLNRALYADAFGMPRGDAAVLSCVLCLLCTQLLPSPVQAFFWYNGAVYYVVYFGLSLAAMALAIRLVQRGGAGRTLLLSLLAVFLGGGNYVTALHCAILGVTALVLTALCRTPGRRRLWLPVLLLLAAFLFSIAAPGNAVRQASIRPGPGPAASVLLSFRLAARYALGWFTLPFAAVMMALAVFLWPHAKRADFSFRFPAPVTGYSFCLLSAMFTPPVYASGTPGDLRLVNIIYFAFVCLFALNLFYWLGWAARRRREGKLLRSRVFERFRSIKAAPAVLSIFLALFVGFSFLLHLRHDGLTSPGALGLMRSGEAQAFRACADRRLEVLEDPQIRDAELEPFPSQPYLLYFDDIAEDPEEWINVAMSRYYGKDSVRLAP